MRRALCGLCTALLLLLGLPAAAPAQASTAAPSPAPPAPTDPLTAQLQQALQRQAQIEATKAALGGEVAAARDEQSRLTALIAANQRSIDAFLLQIAAQQQIAADAATRAAAALDRATAARAKADRDRTLLAASLSLVYQRSDGFVDSVLSGGSVSDVLTRLRQVQQLDDQINGMVDRLRDEEVAARADEAAASAAQTAAQQAAVVLANQKADLDAETAKEQDLIGQLDAQAAAAMTEIRAASQQSVALAQQIAELRIEQMDQVIAEAEQAAWDEAQYYLQHDLGGLPASATSPVTTYYAAGGGQAPVLPPGARMLWPTHGTITQGFGPTSYPFEPSAFGYPHFHTGADIAGPQGTPVYAPADGVVVAATAGTTGYGNHVILALDGHSLCLFGHLEVMVVKPGDTLKAGQLLGLMGSTGNSTGPHLHFEVRVNGTPVDPIPLLPALPRGASGP